MYSRSVSSVHRFSSREVALRSRRTNCQNVLCTSTYNPVKMCTVVFFKNSKRCSVRCLLPLLSSRDRDLSKLEHKGFARCCPAFFRWELFVPCWFHQYRDECEDMLDILCNCFSRDKCNLDDAPNHSDVPSYTDLCLSEHRMVARFFFKCSSSAAASVGVTQCSNRGVTAGWFAG